MIRLPLVPLRNTVIFPVLTVPLSVGRPQSLRSLRHAMDADRRLAVVAQRNPDTDSPQAGDLHSFGVICRILKTIQTAEGHQSVIVQGSQRARIVSVQSDEDGAFWAELEPIESSHEPTVEERATLMAVKELANKAIEVNPAIPDEAHAFIDQIEDGSVLADIIASNLQVDTAQKQALLETLSVHDRLRKVGELLSKEVSVLELSQKIKSDVKGEIDKNQREYFLREQLKAIRKELGEDAETEGEVDDLRKKIEDKKLPERAAAVTKKELARLQRVSQQSPEHGVIRTYLEWITDLPWNEATEDKIDIEAARVILDEDHFDLDKVKKRILEYLAVLKLKKTIKGPILCLVGPPGVGKTSLGKSVARSLGREFVRISLGGVHDEAEIRGHRRTYIGAMPGRILQGLKKAKTINPVFVLDEIDKLGSDYRGDPSSALLEVLDPEQNDSFSDHYLEIEYDLSKILFIATANRIDTIPPALLDRMEIIEIEGYTTRDKSFIAREHLIPKVLEDHGLKDYPLEITKPAILALIENYTREAGVRTLRRELASLVRGVAKDIVVAGRDVDNAQKTIRIRPQDLARYLGPAKFFQDFTEEFKTAGVALGMAWTPVGGDILFIESRQMPGEGRLMLTGKLGDVMKESAQLAFDYIKAHASELGLDFEKLRKTDVHLHVPEGAIPKDGPSAGVTILTSLVSLFSGRPVRSDTAMTGEITLRGNVLPVGGIKSKVIAASRAGVKQVLLPERNRKDLQDIPDDVRKTLKIEFFGSMDQYLQKALTAPTN